MHDYVKHFLNTKYVMHLFLIFIVTYALSLSWKLNINMHFDYTRSRVPSKQIKMYIGLR